MSHADHEWAREQLAAHLAGGLPADERARLEAHAATCAECIAELDALRRFDASMEQMFAPMRARAGLEERMIRTLRQVPQRKPRSPLVKIFSGVAALFLLGLVGFAVMQVQSEVAESARPARDGRNPSASVKSLEAASADFLSNDRAGEVVFGERLKSASEMARENSQMARAELVSPQRGGGGAMTGATFGLDEFKATPSNAPKNAEEFESKRAGGESGRYGGRVRGPVPATPAEPRAAPPAPEPAKPVDAPPPAADGVFATRDDAPERHKVKTEYFRPADAAAGKDAELADLGKKTKESQDQIAKVATKQKPQNAQGQAQEGGQQSPPQLARKIIRSGEMEFEIESFDLAVAKIDAIAAEEQGVIATVNSEKLPNGKVRGTVVVRVPPEHLANLVTKLRALGDLKSQRLGSEDVTKQYTDLDSRLRAARTMEERLIRIIKEGKGEIKDLLQAEKELGEWRTKIELAEGEKRYYDNLISLSTLTVTLFEKEIRAAFGITEVERVDAGVEVEDVEKAYKDTIAAVAEAKGRITKSDLKKLTAGQYSATVNFEVSPDAAGGLRDRLKQLGNVARLDVNVAQQTEGGRTPSPDVKVKRNDTQFFVSLYNLANVAPRETAHLNLATVDAEKAYKAVLDRVEKAAGRVKSSNLNRQKSDQTTGVVEFEVKAADAGAVELDVRSLGEVMYLQITENSDTANVTRSKRGFVVTVAALGTTQARETTTIQLAAKDVAAAYAAISEGVRKAEGRLFSANLNENDRRNVTGSISFDVRRDAMKTFDEALRAAGEVYTRTSNRLQEAQNVVDSKVRFDLTLFPVANVPPRETVRLAVEVDKVDAAADAVQKIVGDLKGRVHDSQRTREADGRHVSRLVVDVPFKDGRAAAQRVKDLGVTRVDESRPNTSVPEGDLAVTRIEVTLSNEVIVPSESAPWASIKKGFSVSALALSWSLTLVMVGLCFVLPLAAIAWGVWKFAKRTKRQPAPPATAA